MKAPRRIPRKLFLLPDAAESDEFPVAVSVDGTDHVVQLIVAENAVAPFRVFCVDDLFHLHDERIFFIDLEPFGQAVIVVEPVSDARKPARIVDGNARGTVEQLFGIENIVNFGVFEHSVRMDARAGGVERPADERGVGRYDVAEFRFEIAGDVGNGGKVHAVVRAAQGGVFDRHRFERAVARTLADAEQGTVDRARAVQPRRGGVGDDFIKIVVAVPFQHFAGHFRMVVQSVYDALHAAGKGCTRIIHAEAHRVAHADLDRDPALARKFHQFVGKRHDETVKVGAGDVFEVAARLDTVRKRALYDAEVFVHRLGAGQIHLFEDVIVGTAHEDTRFGDARVFDQFKVLFVRAYPRGDLGKFQPEVLALFEGAAVFFAVQEKFALPHDPLRPAEAGHEFENVDDLLDRERRRGLLPVAESRIRDPYLRRHIHRHVAVVEYDFGDLVVRVQVAEEFGLFHVLQLVMVLVLFEEVFALVKIDHS